MFTIRDCYVRRWVVVVLKWDGLYKPRTSRNPDSSQIPLFHYASSIVACNDPAFTLEEFISSVENSALLVRWEESDKVEVALLKLAGPTKIFCKE